MLVKYLFIMLLTISAFLINSCSYNDNPNQAKSLIYIVEKPQMKTFVVGQSTEEGLGETSHELNVIRFNGEYEDGLEEFRLKNKLRNVVRSIDNEVIVGYEKSLDNPGFEKVD